MGHHRLKAAAGASPADPYFSSTSLLLLGNGTNGGQNNTFVDSSTNNFTITRNGNTTQGSFSPFSAPDGRWSTYFDGSGDYLSSSSNITQTGDFTIECWINTPSRSGANALFTIGNESSGRIIFFINSSNQLLYDVYFVSPSTNLGGTVPINSWVHIAFVRSGTTVTAYINGVATGTTATLSGTVGNSSAFYIGSSQSGSNPITGYMTNVRVTNSALYTGTFTQPTSPLTAITNTSLLTCQSNSFKDNSSNAFTITPSGDAAVTSFSPFAPLAEYSASSNGGSGYFDGSGDYLSIGSASQAEFNFGSPSGSTNNFTIEGWFYSTGSLNSSNNQLLVGVHDNATCGSWGVFVRSDGVFIFGSGCTFTGGGTISSSTWYHFAIVRSGSTLTVYVNGQQVDQQTRTNDYENSGDTLGVGRQVANGNYAFTGYISSLRILKGTAQYTTTFTPSTSPLTAITNTSLLLNFTNASIIDSTAKNNLETVGDAQVSTSVKKFGTGSLKFDGTGDWLSIAHQDILNFGSSNFTIECWVYPVSNSAVQSIYYKSESDSTGIILALNNIGAGKVNFYSGNGSIWYVAIDSSSTISLNTWTHLAATRNGSTWTIWINGTSSGTATSSTNPSSTTELAKVGRFRTANPFVFDGYIDDLRITKGVARYTAAFTPPSAQLPAR